MPWDENVIGIQYQIDVVVIELGLRKTSPIILLQDIGNLFRRYLYSEDPGAIDIIGKPRTDSSIPEPPQTEMPFIYRGQGQLRLLSVK